MYGERRTGSDASGASGVSQASDGDVAGWLERVGARLRELEVENDQLKRQLADLRRGVGLAVVIDGQLVPLAPAAPSEPTRQQRAPRQAPPQRLEHVAPGIAPTAASTVALASHRTYGPLASTPDELPVVRGLLPAPRQPTREWLGAGDAWPEAGTRRGRPGRTLRHAATPSGPSGSPARGGTYPPARTENASDPLWREREQTGEERNPYTDSFIL